MSTVGNVIDMVAKTVSESIVGTTAAPPAPHLDGELRRRRLEAIAIVERYANLSAVGGVIPVPLANMAAITAIIVRMVKVLTRHYGVPFEQARARAIVIGLLGGVMPAGVATVATSALVFVIPGVNLLGLAVTSVTASAYARTIGQMFVDHFEKGETLLGFPSAVLR